MEKWGNVEMAETFKSPKILPYEELSRTIKLDVSEFDDRVCTDDDGNLYVKVGQGDDIYCFERGE